MSSHVFFTNSINMMPRTPLHRWLILSVFLITTIYYLPSLTGYSITRSSSAIPATPFVTSSEELSWVKQLLKDNSIGPEIEYASRVIRYVPDARERKSITEVDSNLFPDSFTNLTLTSKKSLPRGKILDVHIKQSPRPDQVDASMLIFGASTTYGRFTGKETSPLKEFTRWLTDGHGHSNGAGLILALHEATQPEIDSAMEALTSIGINATVIASNPSLDMPGRYVDLVRMFWEHPTRVYRKYFFLIDDDTFFPYMSQLIDTMSQYNPDKPYYIGTFTERADWLMMNKAPFAYGGGGVVLTAPTVQQIVEAPCLERREDGAYILLSDQGDRLLYNCLHEHTNITLTYVPQLRQLDQFGDPSGVYESGLQHLSLHHYKSWHHFSPDKMHIVADACGEDCVMQRFMFKDNFIISNGYSVAEYPKGIDFDPGHLEATFGAEAGGDVAFEETVFSFAWGVLRKNLSGTGRKRSWEILGARKEGDGRVKQVYLKRRADSRWRADGEEGPINDSVIVLTWIP